MSLLPFKLAGIEAELATSKQELRDISCMYAEAEESRQRHVVRRRHHDNRCVLVMTTYGGYDPAHD